MISNETSRFQTRRSFSWYVCFLCPVPYKERPGDRTPAMVELRSVGRNVV